MKRFTSFMVIVVGVAFLQTIFSCTDDKRKDYEFHYYPAKNVYYDPLTKNYFYSLDGSKTWDSTHADLSNGAALGEKITILTPVAEVWQKNDAHRKEFNGVLYNLGTEDSTVGVAAKGVTEKKDYRKWSSAKKKEVNKREKTKFGKFIDKIFRKKKKDEPNSK